VSVYVITFRSITFAQKAERILKRYLIECTLRRTPKMLAERGCGYCLQLRQRDVLNAMMLIRQHQLHFGKIYELDETGQAEERIL
jgi:hypothetical protein